MHHVGNHHHNTHFSTNFKFSSSLPHADHPDCRIENNPSTSTILSKKQHLLASTSLLTNTPKRGALHSVIPPVLQVTKVIKSERKTTSGASIHHPEALTTLNITKDLTISPFSIQSRLWHHSTATLTMILPTKPMPFHIFRQEGSWLTTLQLILLKTLQLHLPL